MPPKFNSKYAKEQDFNGKECVIFDIKQAATDCDFHVEDLPYSLRVLFENVLRNSDGDQEKLLPFKRWLENKTSSEEINYMPARVLMQDFTGVPAIVDLASMRDAMKKLGGDPNKINPMIPVDLVIDHSVQVDSFGKESSFSENVRKEIERNMERYQFLKWGQENFSNFRVVPPGTGICHQVNLEALGQSIYVDGKYIYPDTLVGTDSHTTMINALSVLGWGVGGIEAEAAMLGQALPMILPEVIGFRLEGELQGTATATDLVLTITEMLRAKGVVGKFVEFFGPGVENLSLADRATISNMAPEYGATCGFFPIDYETVRYLRLTGRKEEHIKIVEEYAKLQSMWRDASEPEYTDRLELDISVVQPSLAGPRRPQDRVNLSDMKGNFASSLPALAGENADITTKYQIEKDDSGNDSGRESKAVGHNIGHGDVVIAAITSCTNTSNPSVMIAAGLVAKKANELGVKVKPWVKTSLAPGSQVVTEYLKKSELNSDLDELGFNLVGYGCTTCIGNSGPLEPEIRKVVIDNKLSVASVLSGNRNFEGRVHPHVRANYLASPPLVVAYAIAGTVNIDLDKDPIAVGKDGQEVYLRDIWPSREEINETVQSSIAPEQFIEKYQNVFDGDEHWRKIQVSKTGTYDWDPESTYINNPPYFEDIDQGNKPLEDIKQARILAFFGDSITTDHISPAGVISKDSPAAQFLIEKGIEPANFNSYGSRRGNHEVMMRGTFANVRIKNMMCKGIEGGVTIHQDSGEKMSIYDAAMRYKESSTPLVVIAGKEYGTGSSRDWAAKGTNLLGIKAVIAESFERIHRSNLVGMGILPIAFNTGTQIVDLSLQGDENISILGISDEIKPYQNMKLIVEKKDGNKLEFNVTLQVYTDNEIEYIKHGSILGAVVKKLNK